MTNASSPVSSVSANPVVAVVGAGYWGKNLIRNFAELGALRRVFDSDPRALEHVRADYPKVRTASSLDEILDDGEIRGVVIATPASAHAAVAKRAIAAGKDVFVEKPLAMTYGDGLEAVEAAETAGVLLMVGHIFVHHPAVKAL